MCGLVLDLLLIMYDPENLIKFDKLSILNQSYVARAGNCADTFECHFETSNVPTTKQLFIWLRLVRHLILLTNYLSKHYITIIEK